jgi:hypothetical protein
MRKYITTTLMILTTVSLICARESAQTLVFLDGFERTESQGITDEVGNGWSSNSEKETKGCTPSKKVDYSRSKFGTLTA